MTGCRDQRQLRRDEQLAHRRRSLDTWRTDDGSLHGKFRLAPAAGDTVQSALQALIAPDPAEVPDDLRRTPRQLRADALVDLADQVLRGGVAGDVGGVRPHVTMTVPVGVMADTLEDAAAAGVVGTTDLGTTLSAAAARKLLCDATVRRLVVDPAGVPLDVGRATRQWSSSQRAAITVVDGGCRAPGCGLPPARCVVHHITWWRDGGTTDVANGVLVCNHGHDLIHDHGWTLTMDPATRVCAWTAPDGTQHLTRPRGPAATNPGIPAAPAAGSGPAPDAPTSTNRTPRPAGTRTIGPAPDRPPPSRRAMRSHRSGREPPEDDTDAATEPRLEL